MGEALREHGGIRRSREYREAVELMSRYEAAERALLWQISIVCLYGQDPSIRREQVRQARRVLKGLAEYSMRWASVCLPALYGQGMWRADVHPAAGIPDREDWKKDAASGMAGWPKSHDEALRAIVGHAKGKLAAANRTLTEDVSKALRRAQQAARQDQAKPTSGRGGPEARTPGGSLVQQVAEWVKRGWTATGRFLRGLWEKGLSCLTDRAGRRWRVTRYIKMVGRTVCEWARRIALWLQWLLGGHDLVQVSDHCCWYSECIPWEGAVLSLTGRTRGYRTKREAIIAGLFHLYCRHWTIPYVPGVTDPLDHMDPYTICCGGHTAVWWRRYRRYVRVSGRPLDEKVMLLRWSRGRPVRPPCPWLGEGR